MDDRARWVMVTTWTTTPPTSPPSSRISICARRFTWASRPGGGEAAHYAARQGDGRAAKVVLIGAVPPIMRKTPANPGGLPIEVFDGGDRT